MTGPTCENVSREINADYDLKKKKKEGAGGPGCYCEVIHEMALAVYILIWLLFVF